jgi:hypothetical protein
VSSIAKPLRRSPASLARVRNIADAPAAPTWNESSFFRRFAH